MNLGALKPHSPYGATKPREVVEEQTTRHGGNLKMFIKMDISGATFFVILIHRDCSG